MKLTLTEKTKKVQNFERLKLFAEKSEQETILRILELNENIFVVTIKTAYNYCARLTRVEYNGYLFETNTDNIKSIAVLSCEVNNKTVSNNIEYIHHIYIQDFIVTPQYRKRGYGTILLKELISYAKKLQVEYINGELSFMDIGTEENCTLEQKENRERLYHFYPKHGFIIDENKKIYLPIRKEQN